jgi:hypothetical protein
MPFSGGKITAFQSVIISLPMPFLPLYLGCGEWPYCGFQMITKGWFCEEFKEVG